MPRSICPLSPNEAPEPSGLVEQAYGEAVICVNRFESGDWDIPICFRESKDDQREGYSRLTYARKSKQKTTEVTPTIIAMIQNNHLQERVDSARYPERMVPLGT